MHSIIRFQYIFIDQNAGKVAVEDFSGQFREIIFDPLNLMIRRVPEAGVISDRMICPHNGIQVFLSGLGFYCRGFSQILAINRGVHEPLEEYVFQPMAEAAPAAPVMLELNAYWGHYSMCIKCVLSEASFYWSSPSLRIQKRERPISSAKKSQAISLKRLSSESIFA